MRKHPRSGFTLIELLVVVVIVGILATLALPNFRNTTGKAFGATLKSDLKNLAAAQESHFYDHTDYAAAVAQLNWVPSNNVAVTIFEANPGGWSALVEHAQGAPERCAIFMGNAAPVAPATQEGQITCT